MQEPGGHIHTLFHYSSGCLPPFLFMTVLTQALFAFVGVHFFALSFFSARHVKLVLGCGMWDVRGLLAFFSNLKSNVSHLVVLIF